nr:type 3 dihydrofolate reductase [Alteromonas halophila]
MIAAMADNRVIGKDNQMPWHLPADLRHFKSVTLGKPVIMGRKTYESIGKALPGRTNIVISGRENYTLGDALVVASPDAALEVAKEHSEEDSEIMVIGGGAIYEAFLPHAATLYLTFIDADIQGDTRFPDYTRVADWVESSSETHPPDESNTYSYRFVTLART